MVVWMHQINGLFLKLAKISYRILTRIAFSHEWLQPKFNGVILKL